MESSSEHSVSRSMPAGAVAGRNADTPADARRRAAEADAPPARSSARATTRAQADGAGSGDAGDPAGVEPGFVTDPAQALERKRDRDYRLNARHIPLLRMVGLIVLLLIVLAWELTLDNRIEPLSYLQLVAVLLCYGAVSWLLLALLYRPDSRFNLGFVFLNVDVLVYLLAIAYISDGDGIAPLVGGVVVLLSRVADQIGVGFWRAVYFCHVVTAAYALFLIGRRYAGIGATSPAEIVLLLSILYLSAMYVALSARAIESLRRITRQAVYQARRLLDERSVQTRQLDEARRQAELASQVKSEFLARMSHELRTPINGVLGMTQLLQGTDMDPKQKRYADTIARSGQSLLDIVEDVLDFAEMYSGTLRLKHEPFDLRELVAGAESRFGSSAREAGLEFSVSLDPRLPTRLIGDRQRLRQALDALIANAIKFTPSGHIAITIAPAERRQRNAQPDVRWIAFQVEDTGIGIDPLHQQAMFEVFTQAEESSARRYGGAGLGLSISQRLVSLMGGEIGVESAPGDGSLFWFVVPLAADETQRHTTPHRLLIADDNEVNRELTLAMLENLGMEAEVVSTGEAALAAVMRQPYALVLMDCQMPGMDGFAATAAIREHERAQNGNGNPGGRHLPIVALTANALTGDRERCLAAGMDDYLSKPYTQQQLQDVVRRHLSR